jgi:hypothetical protein
MEKTLSNIFLTFFSFVVLQRAPDPPFPNLRPRGNCPIEKSEAEAGIEMALSCVSLT